MSGQYPLFHWCARQVSNLQPLPSEGWETGRRWTLPDSSVEGDESC